MAKKIDLTGLEHFKAEENASIAGTESSSTASKAYAVGQYFYFKGDLVICTDPIASGGTITLNTNCKKQPLADAVCELQNAVVDRLSNGNLLNLKTVSFNTVLNTDGTESDTTVYLLSDYISVNPGETLYTSGTVYRAGKYNASKTWLGTITISATTTIPNDTYYIKICSSSANAESIVISRQQNAPNKYGYYPKVGISGIDIDTEASAFNSKNKIKSEEVLKVESYVASGCNVLEQTEYTLGEAKGYVLGGNAAIDGRFTCTSFNLYGVTTIHFHVYIPEPEKITTLSFIVGQGTYSKTSFVKGWNDFAVRTATSTLPSSESNTALRITGAFSSKTKIYLAKVVLYRADKANLIFVEDGGYSTFLSDGYPDLLALRVPVTWALNPGRLGEDTGATGVLLTQAQIDALAVDGNSEFSFHCWAATTLATADMTVAEIQEDVAKNLKYLRKEGICPEHVWRAAHAQNTAPNYAAEIGMVEALATYHSATSVTTFPFYAIWDVPRMALHSMTNAQIDTLFATLYKTHSTVVLYTHGIGSASYQTTTDTWEYFISKLTEAISGGWLRPTTYSRLVDTPSAWLSDEALKNIVN